MVVELSNVMYKVQPVNKINPSSVQLATCMYKTQSMLGDMVAESQGGDSSLVALKDRQLSLLQKIDACLSANSENVNMSSVASAVQVKKPSVAPKFMDIVIHANPDKPPLSLNFVKTCLDKQYNVLWKSFNHSSIRKSPSSTMLWKDQETVNRGIFDLVVTVIWKQVSSPTLILCPSMCTPITGEANLLRYFGRMIGIYDCKSVDLMLTTEIDNMLSNLENSRFDAGDRKSLLPDFKAIMESKKSWLCGNQITIADAFAVSLSMKSPKCINDAKVHTWLKSFGFLA